MRTPLLCCVVFVATAVAAPVPKEVKKKDDAKLLEGRWESVTLDQGQGHNPDTSYWLEIKDGKLSTGIGTKTKGFVDVPFTLDPAESPKHIDITSGGTTQPWIYEIDGDTLTWCHPSGGTERPTGMKSAKPYCCTVWKRVKEEK